jgi:hypothetical protein
LLERRYDSYLLPNLLLPATKWLLRECLTHWPERAELIGWRVAASPPSSQWSGPHWVNVGGQWSYFGNADTNLTYTNGSTTTLGIAVNGGSGWVGGSAGGTVDFSSTAGVSFPEQDGIQGVKDETKFSMAIYDYCAVGDETLPYAYDSGAQEPDDTPPATSYCVAFDTSDGHSVTFTKDNTGAFTFSGGISFPDLGISVDATTGYSTDVTLSMTFTTSGYACGSHYYPGGSDSYDPRAVVADPTSGGNS